MPHPQVYEGTAEEIARQIRDGNLTGRYRAIVVPEIDSEIDAPEEMGETLLERLKGRVGRFDFGDANLSDRMWDIVAKGLSPSLNFVASSQVDSASHLLGGYQTRRPPCLSVECRSTVETHVRSYIQYLSPHRVVSWVPPINQTKNRGKP